MQRLTATYVHQLFIICKPILIFHQHCSPCLCLNSYCTLFPTRVTNRLERCFPPFHLISSSCPSFSFWPSARQEKEREGNARMHACSVVRWLLMAATLHYMSLSMFSGISGYSLCHHMCVRVDCNGKITINDLFLFASRSCSCQTEHEPTKKLSTTASRGRRRRRRSQRWFPRGGSLNSERCGHMADSSQWPRAGEASADWLLPNAIRSNDMTGSEIIEIEVNWRLECTCFFLQGLSVCRRSLLVSFANELLSSVIWGDASIP